jgi:hypothetical protein
MYVFHTLRFSDLSTVRAHSGRLHSLSVFHSGPIFVWGVCMGAQGA